MANTNTNYLPKLLAMGQMALREQAWMPRTVNRSYDNLAAQKGDIINIAIPSAITVRTVTPAVTQAANVDFNPTNVAVTLDFWREGAFHLSDKDELEVQTGTVPMQASEAIKAVGNAVDVYILGKHTGFFGYTGTPGTTPFATDILPATTARKLLNKQLAPVTDRWLVLDPEAEGNAVALSNIIQFDQRGDQQGIIEGSIGRKLGMQWFMDQNVSTFTPGTGWATGYSASTVAGAVGDTTLNITNTTASGTVLVGDLFTFSGENYVITAAATASATVPFAISIYPALKDAVATGAAITVVASAYTVNLAYHRDGLAWASRPLMAIGSFGNLFQGAVDPVSGLALRLELSRQYKQNTIGYDVLGGASFVRREYGAKILG